MSRMSPPQDPRSVFCPRILGLGKGGRPGISRLILIGLLLVSLKPDLLWSGEWVRPTSEQQEIAAAARRYLDAEVRRDFKTVFESLYPSSDYRKEKDFEAYRVEAESSPVRIESYKILDISILEENPDREKLPDIQSFARVEVDVVIRYTDTHQRSLVNYAFPFVKVGRAWYKL